MNLPRLFKRKAKEQLKPPIWNDTDVELTNAAQALLAPPPKPIKPKKRGRVVKSGKSIEYDPGKRRGVVRAMPRNLRQIREGQEAPLEDD